MRAPKIYLETTIFNFYFADDAPEKMSDTLKLFHEIERGKYETFTSQVVLSELEKTSDEVKREKMLSLIGKHKIAVLQNSEEAVSLAKLYVKEGIIPAKYGDDAAHIAIATLSDMQIILSWNFQHIVKLKTRNMVNLINIRERYRTVEICSPMEVIYDE